MKSLIFTTLLLSCLSCLSQEKGNQRSCRIIYLEAPKDAPKEVQLFDGTIFHKVQLPSKNLSEVIKLPTGDLVLSMTLEPVLKSENLPQGAPTVKIPAEATEFYLIVVNDPENKILPIRLLPVNINDKYPKVGETLWVNLTEHTVRGKLGNESITVQPESRTIGKALLPDSGYYKADFKYQPKSEGEFMPVMVKSWWFDATSRNLGFIVKSKGLLPHIFTVRDRR